MPGRNIWNNLECKVDTEIDFIMLGRTGQVVKCYYSLYQNLILDSSDLL